MKVVHVIHGYPPYYMAGSEVYTYNLTKELSKNLDVFVFSRIEDPYERPYNETDEINGRINIRRINKPQRDYTLTDKYLDQQIDMAFKKYIDEVQPDIVHIGHLSHLSTNIVKIIKNDCNLPIVYTLHDFWLLCYRGQAINHDLQLCSKPEEEQCFKCAERTFKEGLNRNSFTDYRIHMKEIIDKIDIFLSPSMFLKNYFERNGVPENKIIFSKYGFDTKIIKYNKGEYHENSNITFGFTGRIIPVKGIKTLLMAFNKIKNDQTRLIIYGDPGKQIKYLDNFLNENVNFKGPYKNWEINNVLKEIDVLIVPSIWYENSPLVIQEAFLAGRPVITAGIGGMAELVGHGKNGYLFQVADSDSLASVMNYVADDPTNLNKLHPSYEEVRSIEDDTKELIKIYGGLLNDR
jgi:glycosyltransferase involved in cell wall biosynthesis